MACLVVVCDFLQVEMKTEKRYCANLALRTQTKQENFATEKIRRQAGGQAGETHPDTCFVGSVQKTWS